MLKYEVIRKRRMPRKDGKDKGTKLYLHDTRRSEKMKCSPKEIFIYNSKKVENLNKGDLVTLTIKKKDGYEHVMGIKKLNEIAVYVRKAIYVRKKEKCVICKGSITGRNIKGEAITCTQKCAGILAWRSRDR